MLDNLANSPSKNPLIQNPRPCNLKNSFGVEKSSNPDDNKSALGLYKDSKP